ncbi:diguanylate cyclase domain-containing protein [Paracidovorax avenae]|uniref:diguanylate cyclase domain-containing protein n=1 Tax=Paracidovorax avenae TaxID=80867 RepID=UPI000AC9CD3E|nr:diguanylate cyclase [Paracidovorax avenae]
MKSALSDELTGLSNRRYAMDFLHQKLGPAPEFRYSCSAGVALVRPGETVGEVLRRADEALYQAKRAGRNRVVIHAESQPAGDGHPCAGNAA